jgi:hypothetical protein
MTEKHTWAIDPASFCSYSRDEIRLPLMLYAGIGQTKFVGFIASR